MTDEPCHIKKLVLINGLFIDNPVFSLIYIALSPDNSAYPGCRLSKKIFDIPNERKVHDGIIPRLGGISFVPTILFSLSFVTGLRYLIGFEIAENRLHFIIPEFSS